jgi:hypothetical protein
MNEPIPIIVENALQIAWDFLERSGEITDAGEASRFLVQTITELVGKGERRRLMLSNLAIGAYRRRRSFRMNECLIVEG